MALGKPLAVRAENGGKVREIRYWQTQSFVESYLLGRVGEMIVAADHMSDFHLRIIDYDHVVVNRHAVGTHDDGIADGFAGKFNFAANDVIELDWVLRNFQAD